MNFRHLAVALLALATTPAVLADPPYPDKVTSTPSLLQYGFGVGGYELPNDGLAYCGPTATSNAMFWLYSNGYSQLAPTPIVPTPSLPYLPTDADPNALNMVRIIAGMMGTGAYSGTNGDQFVDGLQTYFALKGFQPGDYQIHTTGMDWDNTAPTRQWLIDHNSGYSAVLLNIVGYDVSTGQNPPVYTYLFGHFMTFLHSPTAQEFIVANPWPADGPPNPQTLDAVTINDGSAYDGYLDFTNYDGEPSSGEAVVLQDVISFEMIAAPGSTPSTWNLSETKVINTNEGQLDAIAPITGAGGIKKINEGTLTFTNAVTTTGEMIVDSGTLASTVASGTPFGAGSVLLSAGTLAVLPAGTGGNPTLHIASGAGKALTYSGGGALAVDPGSNTGVEVVVGSTDGTTSAFQRSGRGTMTIQSALGNASLGNEVVIRAQSAAQAPPTGSATGLVSTAIVAQDGITGEGDFLTYTAANGFETASYTSSNTVNINDATNTAVYHAAGNQTVTATAEVYALKVDAGVTVGGGAGTTLAVGNTSESAQAGVILNGGSIAVSILDFGSAEGTVFTSNANGAISGVITGTGGVTAFGPGTLTLGNANTYSGGTVVNNGTLLAANASGSATGTGDVTVAHDGRLAGAGTIAGNVTATGTIAPGNNPANAPASSSPGILTIEGNLTLAASTFNSLGSLTSSGGTLLWALTSLADISSGGIHGTDWAYLDVGGALTLGEEANFTIDFAGIDDPNSGNVFWTEHRHWRIAEAGSLVAPNDLNFTNSNFLNGYFDWGTDGNYLTLSYTYAPGDVVPEPSAGVLALAAMVLALASRRRS